MTPQIKQLIKGLISSVQSDVQEVWDDKDHPRDEHGRFTSDDTAQNEYPTDQLQRFGKPNDDARKRGIATRKANDEKRKIERQKRYEAASEKANEASNQADKSDKPEDELAAKYPHDETSIEAVDGFDKSKHSVKSYRHTGRFIQKLKADPRLYREDLSQEEHDKIAKMIWASQNSVENHYPKDKSWMMDAHDFHRSKVPHGIHK